MTDLRTPPRSPEESTSLPEGSGQGAGPGKRDCAELCSLPAGYRRAADFYGATAEMAVPLNACTWEARAGRARGFSTAPEPTQPPNSSMGQ